MTSRCGAGRTPQFDHARRLLHVSRAPLDWFECRRLADGTTYLRWAALFEFLISPDARTIEYRRLQKATNESFTTYLLGQVLSFSLLALGYEPLHATSVVVDGEAVAFLGDCGYGKSTVGAAFVARGFPLLTDDVLVLEAREGRWIAHAGPPRLKLFPSVAQKVLSRATGRFMNPRTSKLVIPLGAPQAFTSSVPLKALYVLPNPKHSRRRRHSNVRIEPLSGQKAFIEIIRAAFNRLQVDRTRLENQFDITTRLVQEVPVRRLTYPRNLSALGALCDAVLNDIKRAPRSRLA